MPTTIWKFLSSSFIIPLAPNSLSLASFILLPSKTTSLILVTQASIESIFSELPIAFSIPLALSSNLECPLFWTYQH